MRQGWELKKLGEVCEIQSGSGFPKKHQGQTSGSYPFYKVSDMNLDGNENQLKSAVNYIDEPQRIELGAKLFPLGAFVFPKVGGAIITNKKRMVFSEGCADNNIMGLIPKSEGLLSEYLGHWLQSQELYSWSNKANPPSITQTTVSNVKIPLPPLEEQKRIIAVLDEAFEGLETARANAEANLKNAEELLTSVRETFLLPNENNVSREDKIALSEVATIAARLVDPKLPEFRVLKHIGAGNIISDSFSLTDVMTAEQEGLKSNKYLFESDNVLYSKIRPYLRKVSLPKQGGLCSADVYPLKVVKELILPEYLFELLLSEDFTDFAIAGSARAGMPKVNREHLFAYRFILPTISHQETFVLIMNKTRSRIDEVSSVYEEKVEHTNELRQSLLQKAFAGELT